MAVKDAEEGVLEVLLVLGLLVGHREDVLHVLAAALVAVASHTQVEADRGAGPAGCAAGRGVCRRCPARGPGDGVVGGGGRGGGHGVTVVTAGLTGVGGFDRIDRQCLNSPEFF